MLARLTYCGDHIAVYTSTRSLGCTPEANIMLYVNYTLIKNLECWKKKKKKNETKIAKHLLCHRPLERMATHSSILAWGIPCTEPGKLYRTWGHKESDTTEWLTLSLSLFHDDF